MLGSGRNWFDQGGKDYARFRPEYPPDLAAALASVSPDHALAVDVGCGNGQLTLPLAAYFDRVIGLDPSEEQIAHAATHPRIAYGLAHAGQLPVGSGRADLVTVAQAAHWFDLPRFYEEVRRIAASGGVLALVSYGVLTLEGEVGERFARFYAREIGPYWPAERKHVDNGYADMPFPFAPITAPRLEIRKAWTLDELLGYIATWSAVRALREASREDILLRFAEDLALLWEDPAQPREVCWPVTMRVGRVSARRVAPSAG